MVAANKNEVTMPTLAIIWISSLSITLADHFSDFNFGVIGSLSWVVVILGLVLIILLLSAIAKV